jgi:SAM-dependent methyltransferase
VLRRMKLGHGAIILEPWTTSNRKPPPVEETWSPFVGAREEDRLPYNRRSAARMRRQNRDLNRAAIHLMAIVPKDHVLELGYGSGDAMVIAGKMARSGFIAGLDSSMEMLQTAWRRTQRAKLKNVSVMRGDVSWLPWSAGSFDKVFCVDGLTEWPCTRSGLEEAFRVLRPNGTLVLAEKITSKFTKSKALALAHLLNVVGFADLDVRLHVEDRTETLLLRAVRP